MCSIAGFLRHVLNWPKLRPVKEGLRGVQPLLTLLNYADFQRLRRLTAALPLAPLRARQPWFVYKYLSPYAVASFSRAQRLATLLNHYHFLAGAAGPRFFACLPTQPVVWRTSCPGEEFTIRLSYPVHAGFECELGLHFCRNGAVLQVLGFVVVPGGVVGAAGAQALLFSQVQGAHDAAGLKRATRTLHDIAPAALLVHAAYGLAAAWGIAYAAGVSRAEQVSMGAGNRFDYDAFWQQFQGTRTAQGLFLLAIPAPERPLESIRANNRGRHLRKRLYKKQVREAVERWARGQAGAGERATLGPHTTRPRTE